MVFKKGHKVPLWLRKKLSKLYIGRSLSEKTKNEISKKLKGRKLNRETKKKISLAKLGDKNPSKRLEVKEKMRLAKLKNPMRYWLGKKRKNVHSKKYKEKLSKKMRGENNPAWIDGRTPINKRIRHSIKFKEWREKVFKRDNFTCQNLNCLYCHNKIGSKLNPHHIKSFAKYPQLRFNVANGITYCENYHKKIEGKLKNV